MMRAWKRMRASTPLPCQHGACSPDRRRLPHRRDPTHTVSTPEHAAASHATPCPWKTRRLGMMRRRVRGMGGRQPVSTPPGRRPQPYPHPRSHSHPHLHPCLCPHPCPRAHPRHHHECATGCWCDHAPAPAAGYDLRTGRRMATVRRLHCRNPHPYGRAVIVPAWMRTRMPVPSCSCAWKQMYSHA